MNHDRRGRRAEVKPVPLAALHEVDVLQPRGGGGQRVDRVRQQRQVRLELLSATWQPLIRRVERMRRLLELGQRGARFVAVAQVDRDEPGGRLEVRRAPGKTDDVPLRVAGQSIDQGAADDPERSDHHGMPARHLIVSVSRSAPFAAGWRQAKTRKATLSTGAAHVPHVRASGARADRPPGRRGRRPDRYNWSMSSGVPTSLPPGARATLLAPSAVTRAVAAADRNPERRWMLRLPRPVRRSFVADVIDTGAGRRLQERWMLLQTDDVRESYIEQVLLQLAEPDTQAVWLLRQDRAVRESYVAEVIDGAEAPQER
jgi:hypothetical protein